MKGCKLRQLLIFARKIFLYHICMGFCLTQTNVKYKSCFCETLWIALFTDLELLLFLPMDVCALASVLAPTVVSQPAARLHSAAPSATDCFRPSFPEISVI